MASSEDGSVVWPSLHIGGHQPGTHHSHQAALPGHTPSTQHEGEYSNTVTSSDSFVNTSDHRTQPRGVSVFPRIGQKIAKMTYYCPIPNIGQNVQIFILSQ